MRSQRSWVVPRSLATAMLTMLVMVNVAWGQAVPPAIPDGKPLTAAQQASIREEMTTLGALLVSGGQTPEEAKLATHAVGTCIGAAYSYDLTRQQADRVCGLVLDAFIIQPGATHYELTAEDRAWLATRALGWTDELAAVLEPDQVTAVQSTMSACLTGYLERGESRGDALGRCAHGLMPLINMPELKQRLIQAASARP